MKELLSLIILFIVGCAAIPISGSDKIRVTRNNSVVEGCSYIGMVKGVDRYNGGTLGQGIAEDNARILLRNNAVSMGADTILLSSTSTTMGGALAEGEAYRCIKKSYVEDSWGDWRNPAKGY